MSAHRPRRHELDGHTYNEISIAEFFAGCKWIPAAILVGLYLLDAFMNHLDSTIGGPY